MSRALAGLLLLLLATSTASAGRAVVDWKDGVSLLSGPNARSKRVARLEVRAPVETLEERAGWVHVRSSEGEGWVQRRSLRFLSEETKKGRKGREEAAEEPPAPVRKAEPPKPQRESVRAEPLGPPPAPAAAPVAAQPPAPAPLPASPPAPVPSGAPAKLEPGGYLSGYDREPAPKTDTGPGIFSVVSALLLVLAMVAGAVYLFRIFSGRRGFGPQKGRGIQILATKALGPRQALVLVEVGGLPLLLAQGEGGVHLLTEIRDAEAVRRLNDLYGFRQTPFEAELHRQLDLESEPSPFDEAETGSDGPSGAYQAEPRASAAGGPSPEERLAALRRRPRGGDDL